MCDLNPSIVSSNVTVFYYLIKLPGQADRVLELFPGISPKTLTLPSPKF